MKVAQSIRQNYICMILAISLFLYTPNTFQRMRHVIGVANADELDDFEKSCDKAVDEYRLLVQSFVKAEREKIAPAHARNGIENSIAIVKLDVGSLIKTLAQEDMFFSEEVEELNKLDKSIESKTSNLSAPTLAAFDQLLQESTRYQRLSNTLTIRLESMRRILEIVAKYKEDFSSLCNKTIPILELTDLNMSPRDLPSNGRSYTRTDPQRFMDDPASKAYALGGGAISFVAAISVYAAIYGVSAAMNLFTISATNGSILLGSTTGAGILIIIIAVGIAYFSGSFKAQDENRRRKERAEKSYSNLLKRIEEIQKWFSLNRITLEDLHKMAETTCIEAESPPHGRIHIVRKDFDQLIMDLKKHIQEYAKLTLIMNDNNNRLLNFVGSYEDSLISNIGASYVKEHRKKLINQEKMASVIDNFNLNIKSSWHNFSKIYAKNIAACELLLFEANQLNTEIDVNLSIIDNLNNEDSEELVQFIEPYKNIAESIKKRISNRASRCLNHDRGIETLPNPIHDIP